LFFPLETKTIPFFAENFKIQGAKAHPAPPPSDVHACIHDASEQCDAAEQMLLIGCQFSSVRIPIEYVVVLQGWYSITSFVTVGLWRSGYQGDRVSETKGNALALGRPH